NSDKIIEQIHDLLEQYSFDQLTPEQKNLVLEHMNEVTYDEMYSALSAITMINQPKGVRGKEKIRKQVLDSLEGDKQALPVLFGFFNRTVSLGKVTALFLILICAGIFTFFKESDKKQMITSVPTRDTVMIAINKEVPIIQKDTIYMEREPVMNALH